MSRSAHTPAPAPQPEPPAAALVAVDEAEHLAASVARVAHRLRLLDELAEMAMAVARRVTQRAVAEAEDAAATTGTATTDTGARNTASDFVADNLAKLSRAVRLTLDLAGRLEETLRRLRAGETAVREARRQEDEARASRARDSRHAAARDKVSEQVAMVIFSESESESESSDLLDALEERLSDDIVYVDVEDE